MNYSDLNKVEINVIALTVGREMCGGSRIFIENTKRWAEKVSRVNIFVTEDGYESCKRSGLNKANFFVIKGARYKMFGLFIFYVALLIKGIFAVLVFKRQKDKSYIVYSASDFWPDSIPAWIMSKLLLSAKWIAGFYLFAPNPYGKESPYKGKNFLRGLAYYVSQIPIYFLVNKFADMVFVTSQPDVERFVNKRRNESKVLVIRGGIDFSLSSTIPAPEKKNYDAVFMGRFHPQKGVLELLDIWKLVCKHKKDAKLLIIGYGLLQKDVEKKIDDLNLQANVALHGYVDGAEKIKLLKSAKVVVHPATYDSGGMAACEAMACGLPGVGFDLPALKTYYPRGMLKTPCFNFESFAKNVMDLLNNPEQYQNTKEEALNWAKSWDWSQRAEDVLKKICTA